MLIHNFKLYDSRHAVPFLLLSLIVSQTTALFVVPGSSCTLECTGDHTGRETEPSDVSCFDTLYNSTATGTGFQECVSCELQSKAFEQSTGQTDIGWALCRDLSI